MNVAAWPSVIASGVRRTRRAGDDDLARVAAEPDAGEHPVADRELVTSAPTSLTTTGHLAAGHERQRRLDLVQALHEQRVDEVDARRSDVDPHVVRPARQASRSSTVSSSSGANGGARNDTHRRWTVLRCCTAMRLEPFTLAGDAVRLEPLVASITSTALLARGQPRPLDLRVHAGARRPVGDAAYIEWLLDDAAHDTVVPFVQRRVADDALVGCTRFLNVTWWPDRDDARRGRDRRHVAGRRRRSAARSTPRRSCCC